MALLRSLHLSVARRIHLSFLVAAALPLLILAVSAYSLVADRLQQHALEDAHQLAKGIGLDIFERLKFVSDELAILATQGTSGVHGGAPASALRDLDLDDRVRGLFRLSAHGVLVGSSLDPPALAALRQAADTGERHKPLLLATGDAARQRLFLLVEAGPDHARDGMLGAELNPVHLWDTVGVAGRPERVCVLDAGGEPVFCNHDNYRQWLRNSRQLVAKRLRPLALADDSGETVLTAAWSLFLKPHYQFERWTVLAGVPQSMALASVKSFDRMFAGVAVAALLLAFLFGRRMIRSNLGPLVSLSDATRHLAAGAFDHRVRLHSGDEFQQLGDAFNGMAEHIGAQFSELETLARLDRELQSAQSVGAALDAAAEALNTLFGEGHSALVCHEHWGPADTLCYRAFAAPGASEWTLPTARLALPAGGIASALGDPDQPLLRRRLGVRGGDDLQVFTALETAHAGAVIAVRDARPADQAHAHRVADVLGIALGNLILERRLTHQANHDWLTGLPTRSRLNVMFDAWVSADGQRAPAVGMLLLGIDRFKQINDTMGHQTGDRLLAAVAARLREALPGECVLGRFAGDQFLMMVAGPDHLDLLTRLSEIGATFRQELDRPLPLGMRELRLSATMGAAVYPSNGNGFEAMLQSLDAAVFEAKSTHRGDLLFFSSAMRESLTGRLDIEQGLKAALANRELVLHYQPVVDAETKRVRSAEALMRWQRPGVGLVMPGGFIEVAEQSGLIGAMGNWAIGEVCRQMRAWRDAGMDIETVNVNVSSVQLGDDELERQVQQALQETGLAPDCLTLEITETALIGHFEESVERLKRLHAIGVRIMIDDFGTGYASLKYLKLLPIDGLKIDRLFVKDLPDSPADEAIVAAVVSLARASGFKLVAEGIETDAQADLLRAAGVPFLQGFLFARGLAAEELGMRLRDEAAAPRFAEALTLRH